MPVEMAANDDVVNQYGYLASVGIAASPFADSKLPLNSIAEYFIKLSFRNFSVHGEEFHHLYSSSDISRVIECSIRNVSRISFFERVGGGGTRGLEKH